MPYRLFDTPIGPCGLAWSDAGVTWVQLPEATREATEARLAAKSKAPPLARRASAPRFVEDAIARIRAHLAGRSQDLAAIPIDLTDVGDFAARALAAAARIPPGRTRTYGDLARELGASGAARAVGRAMGDNPLPLLVPCHRVVAASGKGGFSAYGGVVTKDRLLALEGVAVQTSLFAGDAPRLPFDAARAVRALRGADPPLARLIDRVGPLGLRLKETEDTFCALAESIVYQQLNGKAAATIFARVRALYPRGRLSAERVLATDDAALRGAGLSSGKLTSLKDLADKTKRGHVPSLPELSRMDDEAIVERLTAVRGIGRWTVEMLLIFRLGRPDVLPLADYGIKKGFARTFRRRAAGEALPSGAEIERRGERWRPFRSVASWYLWRAVDGVG